MGCFRYCNVVVQIDIYLNICSFIFTGFVYVVVEPFCSASLSLSLSHMMDYHDFLVHVWEPCQYSSLLLMFPFSLMK